MKLTDGQVKMMQEEMYAELIQILMEKYAYTMEQAMDALYNSETFARLRMPGQDCITKVRVMSIRS
jgi:hypothetical protein